jgi:hypothetical protein
MIYIYILYAYSINIMEMLPWAAGWETKPEKAWPAKVDSTECTNAWW